VKEVPVPVYVDFVCPTFPSIAGINTLPVVFVQAIDTEGNQVLGLSGKDYSALAINSARTIDYIKEQKAAINYYEKCIADHNAKQEGEP
jgi:hypothetical protein